MDMNKPTRFSDYPTYWFFICLGNVYAFYFSVHMWFSARRQYWEAAKFEALMTPDQKRWQQLAGLKKIPPVTASDREAELSRERVKSFREGYELGLRQGAEREALAQKASFDKVEPAL